MKFLVSAFGSRYTGMLVTNLESIERNCPASTTEVYFQDLPDGFLDCVSRAYPRVRFVETHFDFSKNLIQRISSKTLVWDLACRQQPDGELLAFVDVDTIVLKDVSAFLADPGVDVVFTWKDEHFQLNSGVMLARAGQGTRNFFQEWLRQTQEILRTPALYAQANSRNFPYGGGDQMALYQIVGYRPGQHVYEVSVSGTSVGFRAVPCAFLNETNSAPIRPDTHVIHYKGGWQPILLDGKPFSSYRPREACREMYTLYLDTFQSGLARLNAVTGRTWTPEELSITIPDHARVGPGVRQELLYACLVARHWPGAMIRRVRGKASLALRGQQRSLVP